MIDIYDFSECKLNDRYGRYGDAAGNKDGITFNNENWIIKYPKSTRSMEGDKSIIIRSGYSNTILGLCCYRHSDRQQ